MNIPAGKRQRGGDLLVLLCLLPIALCTGTASAGVAPACETLRFEIEGMARTAVAFPNRVPAGPRGAPLVLMFHGHGGRAERESRRAGIHEAWPEAIVVYPQGEPGIPGRTDLRGIRSGWQKWPGEAGDRDLKFVDVLLAELRARYRIDPHRIYAMGHSNGGRFAAVLWAERGGEFAAYCCSAGQGGLLLKRVPPRPVFMVMGRNDLLVPFQSQQASAEVARKQLKTDAAKAKTEGYLTVEPGPGDVELVTYVHPGGHRWEPGATPHIVDFFKRHALAED